MKNSRTGQTVGCIYGADIWFETDDGSRRLRPLPNPPIKGHIYTIKTMKSLQKANLVALEFEEMAGWWDARAFRPMVEHKTEISVFKRMLAPKDRVLA